ncbi:MAG: SDR family NAD(P)-dependent oxidoreductase [Dehalococcoidia bacterium]|nr:MAG: SDR family NAD(P)-dependent oxidoreductase [Dehalococcoidia bacterium]
MSEERRVAVITGASSGIGAAAARRLAAEGFDVVAGARRLDKLREITDPIGATAIQLDVRDHASVEAFAAQVPRCDVLVNNAGGALGLEPLAEADEEKWRQMWETNVLGLMLVTRALLPKLITGGNGHIVNIGSIAGFEAYPGGAGYTSVKHGVRAISHTLRLELLGKPVRVTEIDPGMVETEFSVVRFAGDEQRAARVYEGLTPLTGDDIADCIAWAVTRPRHVNIDEMVVRPLAQATATQVARNAGL